MEKVSFEQLKKEALVEKKNEYKSPISVANTINSPMLKILFDYFNILNDRKKMQKEQGIEILGMLSSNNRMVGNLPESVQGNINYKLMLNYKDELNICLVLSRYMADGQWVCEMSISSETPTYISSDFIYKKILYSSIASSNLKGSYFIMPPKQLAWQPVELTKRDYSDIFLPSHILDDLKLYTGLFEKTRELQRYLFVGTPGTGKTESTLAISNVLKRQGVTIIKTSVCEALKEKVELAELLSPSLIIFDDIDLSLGSRSKGGVSHTLGGFLDVMDGTDKVSDQVGIIATTNSVQLLDLAAQRPGRFDKIMSFDSITSQNVKDIVLKSLKHNFSISKNQSKAKIFTDSEVIDKFKEHRLTGAHIFSSVKQIMRKVDILDIKDVDAKFIISELENEIKTLKKIRNAQYLKDGLLKDEDGNVTSGFDISDEDSFENEDVSEEIVEKGGQIGFKEDYE